MFKDKITGAFKFTHHQVHFSDYAMAQLDATNQLIF